MPLTKTEIKLYTALLNQTSTNAPIPTIQHNTIGNIAWARTNTGIYTATLNNAFPINKTWVILKYLDNNSFQTTKVHINENIIQIQTRAPSSLADDVLIDTEIEIRVYHEIPLDYNQTT